MDQISKEEIFDKILNLLSEKDFFIIALDGRCGSGKTTFAQEISEKFNFDVVHLDDFFLPLELRTKERLSEIGGNIHYERLFCEVIINLKKKQNFSYKKFDCKTMTFTKSININTNRAVIVEGAYSLRPEFDDIFDLKIFCDVDKALQKERIIKRNGLENYKNFKKIWIPKEEKYLKSMKIEKKCDYKIFLK
ncbi:MAG: NB-ARC domain-containing protein [Clostridia bacterium]